MRENGRNREKLSKNWEKSGEIGRNREKSSKDWEKLSGKMIVWRN